MTFCTEIIFKRDSNIPDCLPCGMSRSSAGLGPSTQRLECLASGARVKAGGRRWSDRTAGSVRQASGNLQVK